MAVLAETDKGAADEVKALQGKAGKAGRAKARSQRPPEGAPPRSRALELEGYRGLAALSTVVFHVWQQYVVYDRQGGHPPLDNPFVAAVFSFEVIDFFFVMSAYLLTLTYARAAIDGGSTRPAGVFLFRRAVRIVPLYFFAVLVIWSIRNPVLPGDWLDLVEHLTFTHVFDQKRIFYTLGPAWSLSLEIVFYLVLVLLGPLAARVCRWFSRRSTRVAVCAGGCLLLYVAPIAWIAIAHYALGVPETNWPVYFGPHARFSGFAAGMGLAVLTVALDQRGRLGAWSAVVLRTAALAGLYVLSLLALESDSAPHTFYHPVAGLLWALVLLSTIHVRQKARWHRMLRARRLTGVGLISYSLYIWHEPVMLQLAKAGLIPAGQDGFLLAVPIVLLVTLPVAALSYWIIEYPWSFLVRLKGSTGRPRDFYPEPAR